MGESKSVDDKVDQEWIGELGFKIIGYQAIQIFNADETALFVKSFQAIPTFI